MNGVIEIVNESGLVVEFLLPSEVDSNKECYSTDELERVELANNMAVFHWPHVRQVAKTWQ